MSWAGLRQPKLFFSPEGSTSLPISVIPKNHKNSGFAVSVGIECGRRDPDVRMIFAGASSPAVPVLEERIAAAGMESRIRFVGIRKDIERLMLASDVLLFPSRAEGLGMVAVEAQAAGLPVLASTAVPAECVVVPELVRFKKVEEGEAAWADDLLQLAVQPRDIPCANQRVAASEFSIENSSSALARLYARVLGLDQFYFESTEGPQIWRLFRDERRGVFRNQQSRARRVMWDPSTRR